jgi:2-oxoglutarate dehydrogenase E2 component (dihydrolipoamide succinyltransferase)
MPDITVPKLNTNDDSYVLLEWLFDDGAGVAAGDVVAVVETSKAIQDLDCPDGGVLHRLVPEKAECRPGQVLGRLFADEADRQRYLAAADGPPDPLGAELTLTASARALADERGVSMEQLRTLGRTLIRRSDVERIAAAAPPTTLGGPVSAGDGSGGPAAAVAGGSTVAGGSVRDGYPLSRRQRAIAAVVGESHRTVPAAFTVMRVEVDAALAMALAVTDRVGAPVGLPELLVKAVAGLHTRFPECFARLTADGTVEPHPAADVGVTVDVGTGLLIPVVRDAAGLTVADIAERLMELRIRALRDALSERDLTDAAIAVSLNTDDGVVFARPIVFPGQTCMVSLGGVLDEVALDASGQVVPRRVVHVGLAYDHRVVNGRAAVLFLQQIRAAMESPDRLDPAPAGSEVTP